MSNTVLTKQELDRIWREGLVTAVLWPHNASQTPVDILRAVEAAVIAKMNKIVVDRWGAPCVSEREARRREREAYTQGVQEWPSINTFVQSSRMNRLYPPPAITRPRTVTLSDGTTVHGEYDKTYGDVMWIGSNGSCALTQRMVWLWAKTPADARALADLIERPTEEVADD